MGIEDGLALDIVQFSLDMVGIVEPTPFADGASGLISLARGEWLNAAISGASMLPYLGDAAKLGKLPKYAHSVAEAIKLAARDEKFAARLRPALERLYEALGKVPLDRLPKDAAEPLRGMMREIEAFLKRGLAAWEAELKNPALRRFDAAYHGDVALLRKTKMDLKPADALAVLRDAVYDTAEAAGKAPSLWGFKDGKIYRFMFDNRGLWHGYPAAEKPPMGVLRQWLADKKITNAEYGKILQLPHRGK